MRLNIREHNEVMILNVLRQCQLSLTGLMYRTKMSRLTIKKHLKSLANKNLIRENGYGESIGGRKPILYKINENMCYAMGVYFEIPSIHILVVNLEGVPVLGRNFTVNEMSDPETIINELILNIKVALSELGTDTERLLGINLALPGFFKSDEGISLAIPRLPKWTNVPLASMLKNVFNTRVNLISDSVAMALGEKRYGVAKEIENFVYISVHEGVSTGLIINNQGYHGPYGNAGLLGHFSVGKKGKKCYCGNKGCLEAYISEGNLANNFRRRVATLTDSTFSRKALTGKNDRELVKFIMAQFRHGHPTVRKYVTQKMELLSLSIANLIKLMELDYIVLGGYLKYGGQNILDLIQGQVKSHLHPVQQTNLTIVFGKVDRAAQLGATVTLIDALFELPLSV